MPMAYRQPPRRCIDSRCRGLVFLAGSGHGAVGGGEGALVEEAPRASRAERRIDQPFN